MLTENSVQTRLWLATVAFIALAAVACAPREEVPSGPPAVSELEGIVRSELLALRGTYGFPGATAAFVMPDGRVGRAAIGVEDPRTGLELPIDGRMPAGSIGKIFVAGVAVSLVQDGVISIDDPLSRWTSEKPWYPRLAHADEITLRMLLTHSAGVPNHIADPSFSALMEQYIGRDDHPTPDELAETIVGVASTGPPGHAFSYTDAGFVLAGIAMEEATGKSYWTLLEERVLRPFELKLTTPGNRRRVDGVVQGFVGPRGMLGHPPWAIERGQFLVNPAIEYTGGGVISHPIDLARWARELWSGEAFGEASLAMLFDAVPTDAEDLSAARYGIGVFIEDTRFGRRYSHRGTYPGYKSITGYLSDHDLSIAVQINSSEPSGAVRAVFEPLAAALLERL